MGTQAVAVSTVKRSAAVSRQHRPATAAVRSILWEPTVGNQAAIRMAKERQKEGDDHIAFDDRQADVDVSPRDMNQERQSSVAESSASDRRQPGRGGPGAPLVDMGAVGRVIAGVVARVIGIIATLAATVAARIATLVSIVTGIVLGRFMALMAGIGRVASLVISLVASLAAQLVGLVRGVMMNLYALTIGRIMALAGPIISAVSSAIRSMFATLRPFIALPGIIGRVTLAVAGTVRQIARMVSRVITTSVLAVARSVGAAIRRSASAVINFVRRLPGIVRTLLMPIINRIRSRLLALVAAVIRAVMSWIRIVIAFVARLVAIFIRALIIYIRGLMVALGHLFRTLIFPSYSDIVADSTVRGAAGSAWTDTKAAATATGRREIAFWIRLNMAARRYEIGPRILGPVVGPADGAYVNPGSRPADTAVLTPAAVYTVGLFHTHTPTTHRTVGRGIGPSTADENFHNSHDIAGVVYDYVESPAGSGNIPAAHPLHSTAQLYHSGPNRRSKV